MAEIQTRVCECSTLLGLATVSALLRRAEEAGRGADHTVLIFSANSRYPEIQDPLRSQPAAREYAETLFDEILSLNDYIFPMHPSQWRPPARKRTRAELLSLVGGERVDELWVESLPVAPSRSLAELFADARITVYSDGLMVYSPTRDPLPDKIGRRVDRVAHIDFLPGVAPLLLEEHQVAYEPLPIDELKPFFSSIEGKVGGSAAPSPAILYVGQAMANAVMMSPREEDDFYLSGLARLSQADESVRLLFKPHPSASVSQTRLLAHAFHCQTGRDLEIVSADVPMESLFARESICAVTGIFSTALFTASRLYGIPAFSDRPKDVMVRLQPYANSNRIPLLAADLGLPKLDALIDLMKEAGDGWVEKARYLPAREEEFLPAQIVIGFHMQPRLLSHRKDEVESLARSGRIRHLDVYLAGASDLLLLSDRWENAPAWWRFAGPRLWTGVEWSASRVLRGRKLKKFQRDPQQFFFDSKSPVLRLVGGAFFDNQNSVP